MDTSSIGGGSGSFVPQDYSQFVGKASAAAVEKPAVEELRKSADALHIDLKNETAQAPQVAIERQTAEKPLFAKSLTLQQPKTFAAVMMALPTPKTSKPLTINLEQLKGSKHAKQEEGTKEAKPEAHIKQDSHNEQPKGPNDANPKQPTQHDSPDSMDHHLGTAFHPHHQIAENKTEMVAGGDEAISGAVEMGTAGSSLEDCQGVGVLHLISAPLSGIVLFNTFLKFGNAIKEGSAGEVAEKAASLLDAAATGVRTAGTAVANAHVVGLAAKAGVVAGAAAAAAIAAPIAAGLGLVAATVGTIKSAMEAHELGQTLKEAKEMTKQLTELEGTEKPEKTSEIKMAKVMMEKVCDNVQNERKNSILSCLRSLVIAIGCGLAAVAAVGLLLGLAITPVGWAAAGCLLVGMVATIALNVYKSKQEAKVNEEIAAGLKGQGANLPSEVQKQVLKPEVLLEGKTPEQLKELPKDTKDAVDTLKTLKNAKDINTLKTETKDKAQLEKLEKLENEATKALDKLSPTNKKELEDRAIKKLAANSPANNLNPAAVKQEMILHMMMHKEMLNARAFIIRDHLPTIQPDLKESFGDDIVAILKKPGVMKNYMEGVK